MHRAVHRRDDRPGTGLLGRHLSARHDRPLGVALTAHQAQSTSFSSAGRSPGPATPASAAGAASPRDLRPGRRQHLRRGFRPGPEHADRGGLLEPALADCGSGTSGSALGVVVRAGCRPRAGRQRRGGNSRPTSSGGRRPLHQNKPLGGGQRHLPDRRTSDARMNRSERRSPCRPSIARDLGTQRTGIDLLGLRHPLVDRDRAPDLLGAGQRRGACSRRHGRPPRSARAAPRAADVGGWRARPPLRVGRGVGVPHHQPAHHSGRGVAGPAKARRVVQQRPMALPGSSQASLRRRPGEGVERSRAGQAGQGGERRAAWRDRDRRRAAASQFR